MRTNIHPRGRRAPREPNVVLQTHEGAPASVINPLAQLRRSVCSCLLWESEFYEDGMQIAARIAQLVAQCSMPEVAQLAIEAREQYHLRHVPLLLLRELARHPQLKNHPKLVSQTLARVCRRADEPAEFLSIYWREGKRPLSKQVKRGLAWALRRFDEFELAKYNREGAVKLRDVLFLAHAKPKDEAQAKLWKKLAANELTVPDTWEVALSAGADKKATFERLLREGQLGYLALLRNLRNMVQAGVDEGLVRQALLARIGAQRVLPFRYITAARHAPQFEPQLDTALLTALATLPKLPGATIVLVDNSGSMGVRLSGKSEVTRADAACGVAIIARGMCEHSRVFVFSDRCVEVPARQGIALRDAIQASMSPGGTNLGAAVQQVSALQPDRLIVVTDEQSHDPVDAPHGRGYLINVASAKNGVGYGPWWVHLDGWSEAVVRFIAEHEKLQEAASL